MDERHGLRFWWTLFGQMFVLSAFTLGGGYVIIPLMRERFVQKRGWLSEEEMLNLTAIAQACPGSIAINVAVLIGLRMAGVAGLAATVLGTAMPPLILLSLLSYVYRFVIAYPLFVALMQFLQLGVAVLLIQVIWDLTRTILKLEPLMGRIWIAVQIFFSFILAWTHVIPIPVLIAVTVIGGALFSRQKGEEAPKC